MGILQRIKQSFLATRGGFEMSSSNGLPHAYALLRARGEGGNPDPELEAVLARKRPEAEREAEISPAGARSCGHDSKAKSTALCQEVWPGSCIIRAK